MGKKPTGMSLNKLGHIHNSSKKYNFPTLPLPPSPQPIGRRSMMNNRVMAVDLAMQSSWSSMIWGGAYDVNIRTRTINGYPQMKMASSREATKQTANLIAQDILAKPELLPDKVFEREANLTSLIMTALHKADMVKEAKQEYMEQQELDNLVSMVVWHSELFLDAFPHYETMQELVE